MIPSPPAKFLALTLALLSPLLTLAADPVPLIGYGTVQASFSNAGALFQCQDQDHADILLDKLKADLTWDPQAGVREIKLPNGAPAYQLEGAGILSIARVRNSVLCFTGPTPEAVAASMQQARLDSPVYASAKPHPASLDYFDLNAVRISIPQLKPNTLFGKTPEAYSRDAFAQEVQFWSKLHISMGANVRDFFGDYNRVDGPPHTFPTDYEMNLAKQAGMSVNVWIGPNDCPWWLRNLYPFEMDQSEGLWSWGKSAFNLGAAYTGSCMNDAVRAYVDRFDFDLLHDVQRVMGDGLSSVRIATGRPGDEMAFHGFSYELMDRSMADARGFCTWVQQKRHLDLPSLGNRWYGEPNHFRSWDQVQPPSFFEFYGHFGYDTFDLDQGWLWHPDSTASGPQQWGAATYQPGPDWTPVDLMTTQQLMHISATKEALRNVGRNPDAWWFRKQFDPSFWLGQHPGKPVYLVVEPYSNDKLPIQVYLNGTYLGAFPTRAGILSLDVTSRLKSGPNLLSLELTNDGVIRGPVFLTSDQPQNYPYLGIHANARWVDFRDWLVDKIIDGYARTAAPVLESIPDIPILLVPGSDWSSADHFLGLKQTSGFSAIHDTGSEASYRPYHAGLGYVIGTYASSEESNSVKDPGLLSAELAWFLLDAEGEHNYVPNADVYLQVEHDTGWFTKNARLIQLLGKANWVPPSIALLRSAKNTVYLRGGVGVDLGTGALQSVHRNNVYVTEAEVKAGLISDYPVLFDTNSLVMDQEEVAAIRQYVENGGTFIASNLTGRHSPLVPGAWPISALTGFKVVGDEGNEPMTIAPGNPLFKAIAGQSFGGAGVALQPADPQAQTIASWKDGSVAIGMRPIGKGRVIILGSDFWRYNGTISQSLADLLDTLGIKPEVQCNDAQVWTRREITKNGLQEWILAYNTDRVQPRPNTSLSFAAPQQPARIFDLVTGEDVPFIYTDGIVRISRLNLDANQIRILAMSRGGFANALPVWYAEKTKYWRRIDIQPKIDPQPRPPYTAIVFDKLRFRPATEAAFTDLTWQQEPVDGGAWKDATFGFWDEMGYPAQGVGLYRTTFTLPAEASQRRYDIGLISFDTPVFYGNASVYLNGAKVIEYKQHYWSNFETSEVTGTVHPGINELAVIVSATNGRGGYVGQMALYPLLTLQDVQPLTNWKLFRNNTDFKPVTTPILGSGYFVRTDAMIPAAWAGKPIYLELSSSLVGPALIALNGSPVSMMHGEHPVGGVYQTNISAVAKPGQINQIEIWCTGSVPYGNEPVNRSNITLEKVCLGVAASPEVH